MVKTFHVKISLPNKVCIDKDCVSVNMPTSMGYITILRDHSPIIGAIAPGYLTIVLDNGNKLVGLINYGVYQFEENNLTLLSDFFQQDDKIDPDVIQSIKDKINAAISMEDLLEKTANKLNQYTKLISAKASDKKDK